MASPAKPLAIRNARKTAGDASDNSQAGTPQGTPVGTPDIRAIRARVQNAVSTPPRSIPARALTPGSTPGTPYNEGLYGSPKPRSISSALAGPSSTSVPSNGLEIATGKVRPSFVEADAAGYESDDNPLNLDDFPDEEKARVLRRHLVSKAERGRDREVRSVASEEQLPQLRTSGSSHSRSIPGSHIGREESEPFPIPYDAPGADVTCVMPRLSTASQILTLHRHDIYKWQSDHARPNRVRAQSYAPTRVTELDPAFEHIHEPGGFRRNYVLRRAEEEGFEEPRIMNNFIDFLFIFGHFVSGSLVFAFYGLYSLCE